MTLLIQPQNKYTSQCAIQYFNETLNYTTLDYLIYTNILLTEQTIITII